MGKHPRILIVDDDADVRAILEELLERKGYETTCASNGAEAIELIEAGEHFSMVLADLVMPGIIGNELLEYLAADEAIASIPVAIMTGSPHLAPPGYRVFRKPVSFQALLAYLREHCAPAREHDHAVRAEHDALTAE